MFILAKKFFLRLIVCAVACLFVTFDAYCTMNNPKFTVTTTTLSPGDRFIFVIDASGTFYVDCGDGGTLNGGNSTISGPSDNVYTINHNSVMEVTYTCSYTTGGKKTINFGGVATGYGTSGTPSINFSQALYGELAEIIDNPDNDKFVIETISGDLSDVFPSLANAQPNFYNTFQYSGNLKAIPDTLFAHITGAGPAMFMYAFADCYQLESIPSGLFASITTNNTTENYYRDLFDNTFLNCKNLKSIPSNLFASVTIGAEGMFRDTFLGCTSLESIPSDLFNFGENVVGKEAMFAGTFQECTSLESIPSGLFSRVTGGAEMLFWDTFKSCSSLKTIPDNLFSTITTGAYQMFYYTFSDCTSLTSVPPHLFSNIETDGEQMFLLTFYGDTGLTGYIPPTLVAKLTPKQSSYSQYTMYNTFFNTGDFAKTCPDGTEQYYTGYESQWSVGDGQTRKSCVPLYFSVTYNSGNCSSNDVNNQYGTTHSETDPTTVEHEGQYTVLAPSNNVLFGNDFQTDWDMLPNCATFMGWKNPNISGTDYDYYNCAFEATETCSPTIQPYNYVENLNLYAYCQWNTYNVTYHGCDNTTNTQSLKYGDAFSVPTYQNYTFNGWEYGNQSLGNTFPSDLCIKGETLDLYANCTPKTYTIEYHDTEDLGATWEMGQNHPTVYTYGIGETIGIPNRTNYVFKGWCVDNPNCTNYQNNAGGYTISTTMSGNIHMYAKWETAVVGLSWIDDGQPYDNQPSCQYGSVISNITHATKPGHTFVGWKVTNWCPFVDSVCGLNGNAVNNFTYNNSYDTLGYCGHDQTSNQNNTQNQISYGLSPGEWALKDTTGGVLKGTSSCNSTTTIVFDIVYQGTSMTPAQEAAMLWNTCDADTLKSGDTFSATASGQSEDKYCWCKMTSYTPYGGTACNITNSSWVLNVKFESASGCAINCASQCAIFARDYDNFRRAIFGVKE